MINILLCALSLFAQNDFDTLMGKSTPHWNYVTLEEDQKILQFAKALYEKNGMRQVSEGPYKIPPVIHFIWLGPRPFPPESIENVRSWIALNPGWTVKFWTDREREPPCEGMQTVLVKDFAFSKLKNCFDRSQNDGEKSDILRYEILNAEGGVYVDHDANCLKSFQELHRTYDFYCGFETPHEAFVGRNITCGNSLIGARANHPVMKKAVDLVLERWDRLTEKFPGKDPYSIIEVVMQRTYIALTDAMEGTIDQSPNVDIIFPAAYFLAKSGLSPLYSRHAFATTWDDFKMKKNAPKAEKILKKLHKKNHHLLYLSSCLIVINGLLIALFLRKKKVSL